MKKVYMAPVMEEVEAQVVSILAESLIINQETTVNGADALIKENAWANIWGDDEE